MTTVRKEAVVIGPMLMSRSSLL